MPFSDFYGDSLSIKLGSSDTTELFTTERRKNAINDAALWFVTETSCLWKTGEIPIVSGTAEYDLELLLVNVDDDNFIKIAPQGPMVTIANVSKPTRYFSGREFPRRTIQWLDDEMPSWRADNPGEPIAWYERSEAGQELIGVYPTPLVASGDSWSLLVPYVIRPDTMTADDDEPFSVEGDSKVSLTAWFDALLYYAVYLLEPLRKDLARAAQFKALADERVRDYKDKQVPPRQVVIQLARNYRDERRTDDEQPWGARFNRTWL
jgi:hypothetical protein